MAYNYTELQILRGDSASNSTFVGKAGMLVADMETTAQFGIGTLRLHDGTTAGGFIFGHHAYSSSYAVTASYVLSSSYASSALSSSYAATSSYALNANAFPFSGSAVITGSLTVSQSGIVVTGSLFVSNDVVVGGTLTAREFYTEFVSASIIFESGSTKFGNSLDDTHQFTGSIRVDGGITGSLLGTSSNSISSSYSVTASYAIAAGAGAGFPFSGSAIITGSLLVSSSGINVIGTGITASLFGTSSWSTYAATASYISGGVAIRNGLTITGSLTVTGSETITGSLYVRDGIYGYLFGTSSNSISSSYAVTASYSLNAASGGSGTGFPFSGSAVITGSLLISGSGLRVTGSTDIVGNFTATTKSFKIQHQRKPGKHLVYGVLEGPEHSVFVRGKLENNNVIVLPNEWEWLIDTNTITVHLTPIGKQQHLYVKQIDGLYITVENGAWFTGDVHCYYTVYATRKDTVPLETVV